MSFIESEAADKTLYKLLHSQWMVKVYTLPGLINMFLERGEERDLSPDGRAICDHQVAEERGGEQKDAEISYAI